jgi:hypothetical protein
MGYCVLWYSSFLCSAVFRRDLYFVDNVLVTCVLVATVFVCVPVRVCVGGWWIELTFLCGPCGVYIRKACS